MKLLKNSDKTKFYVMESIIQAYHIFRLITRFSEFSHTELRDIPVHGFYEFQSRDSGIYGIDPAGLPRVQFSKLRDPI